MLGKQEWTPNTDRLVRSAMSDERYCSFILDCLHFEQHEMTLQQLNRMWDRASKSDLTVDEFIRYQKGEES
jgi:hypothetical protein